MIGLLKALSNKYSEMNKDNLEYLLNEKGETHLTSTTVRVAKKVEFETPDGPLSKIVSKNKVFKINNQDNINAVLEEKVFWEKLGFSFSAVRHTCQIEGDAIDGGGQIYLNLVNGIPGVPSKLIIAFSPKGEGQYRGFAKSKKTYAYNEPLVQKMSRDYKDIKDCTVLVSEKEVVKKPVFIPTCE